MAKAQSGKGAKRQSSFISLLFRASGLLWFCFFPACSGPNPVSEGSSIVLWEQEDAQVAPYIDSVIDGFKRLPENAGLEITRTHYQTEDLRQQFQAASLAGVPPDLLMGPSDTAGLYAAAGFIRPVEDLIDVSAFNKAAAQAISLDAHVWGVPVSNGNHLMLFYNKKFVKSPPKDTGELFRFCAEEAPVHKLDFCMALDMGDPFWIAPWVGAFGGWLIDGKRPTLDTPAMRSAINFYLDIKFAKKYAPPECDYNCIDSLFKEGRTAFIINGDWALSGYRNHFKKDFGLALIPKLSQTGLYPSPMVSGKYIMVSSGVKPARIALIKRFLEFYAGRENQLRQFRELQRLPALAAASGAPEITGSEIARVSMDELGKGRPMSMAVEMRAVWDSARNYLGLAMSKKMSVDEAVRRMQRDADSRIAEMNR